MDKQITMDERSELKARLRATGQKHEAVAQACGVAIPTVSLWFAGDVSSPALDKAIPAYIYGVEHGLISKLAGTFYQRAAGKVLGQESIA